jgi:hypothetical protein
MSASPLAKRARNRNRVHPRIIRRGGRRVTKTIEKNHRPYPARGARLHSSGSAVLLHYAIARREVNSLELFRVSLKSGVEVLPVFSSRKAAQSFVYSNVSQREWYCRECSPGELVSLLLGPYVDLQWVLLDPLPRFLKVQDRPANLMHWKSFVDYLLG